MVVKMIVSFNRNGKGQGCLREILGPLINRVLEDKTLQISTNPVEIYKSWVNSLEYESGKSAGMPYEVTVDDALQHEEVRRRLKRSITQLKQVKSHPKYGPGPFSHFKFFFSILSFRLRLSS